MQEIPQFERLSEWEDIATKIVEAYPLEFGHIEVPKIICYVVTNKERVDTDKIYEMQTDKLPMRLTNSHDYFVWFKHPDIWNEKPDNIKNALVADALSRIDPSKPYSIKPYEYKDNLVMVSTFGVNWWNNASITDILKTKVKFRCGLE